MKKVFYCLTNGYEKTRKGRNYSLLKAAAKQRDIEFVELATPAELYSMDEVPQLAEGGLYQLNISKRCLQYRNMVLSRNPQLKTWVKDTPLHVNPRGPWARSIMAETMGTPVIPTLYGLTNKVDDTVIEKIEKYLGGFPIIVKKNDSSHGGGVVHVDSIVNLKTILPHLIDSDDEARFIAQKFIQHAEHYRIVVLEDKILSVIRYLPQKHDIRTNAVEVPSVEPATISKEWQTIAINAVAAEGQLFGGVDLLADKDARPYIAEVNTPCNFSRSQDCTGDDIAGAVVEYFTA